MVKWLHDKFLICHFQVNSLNFFRQFVGRMERICIRFNIFDVKNVSRAFFLFENMQSLICWLTWKEPRRNESYILSTGTNFLRKWEKIDFWMIFVLWFHYTFSFLVLFQVRFVISFQLSSWHLGSQNFDFSSRSQMMWQ